MTDEIVFTKRVAASGSGFLVWIPKNVSDYLVLKEGDYLSCTARLLEKKEELRFVKKVSRSGRGLLLWIPHDISGYMKLGKKSYIEMKVGRLGGKK